MKVLLIQPPLPEDYLIGIYKEKSPCIPLGLAYLAAILEHCDNEVSIIDCEASRVRLSQVENKISEFLPDVVGITATTLTFNSAVHIAEIIKTKFPQMITVFGGSHITFTAVPSMIKHPCIDYSILGEGEESLPELVHALEMKKRLDIIPGLAWRKGEDIQINGNRFLLRDINRLPFPSRDHFNLQDYVYPNTIITSRGCPQRCIFCGVNAQYKGTYRVREVERVLDELELLTRMYPQLTIPFVDDNFTAIPGRVKNICNGIIERSIDMEFMCQAHVANASQELYDLMKEAGCKIIQIGMESGDENILQSINKNSSRDRIESAIQMAINAGIRVIGSFIIGLPDDTEETIMNTFRFADELNNKYHIYIDIGMCTPYPGTTVYLQRDSLGITIEDWDWERFDFYTPNISTRNLHVTHISDLFMTYFLEYKNRFNLMGEGFWSNPKEHAL